jgi:hypothetical protein
VDRQEGGMDAIRAEVPDARALISREELMARWREIHPETA